MFCNGSPAQTIAGYTYYNLTINKSACTTTVTSSVKAFTVINNLTVTNGDLVLAADDADYRVLNFTVSYTNEVIFGTVSHNVVWGYHAVVITGNLTVDGQWIAVNPSFIKMHAPTGTSVQTLRTGDNFPTSSLGGLLIETEGNAAPGGTFNLSGTLRAFKESYVPYLSTGSLHLNGYHAIFSGDFLWNMSGGSVYIDAGTGGSSPVLDVTAHIEFDGAGHLSAGTFNVGDYLDIEAGGSLTCTNTPAINIGGTWFNNNSTSAFTAAGSTINFNGGFQSIGGSASTTFNHLVVKPGSTTSLSSGNCTVNGNLTIESGGTFTNEGLVILKGNLINLNP